LSDYDAILARALKAVAAGIAEVEVRSMPIVVANRNYDSHKDEAPVVTLGEQVTQVTVSWTENQP